MIHCPRPQVVHDSYVQVPNHSQFITSDFSIDAIIPRAPNFNVVRCRREAKTKLILVPSTLRFGARGVRAYVINRIWGYVLAMVVVLKFRTVQEFEFRLSGRIGTCVLQCVCVFLNTWVCLYLCTRAFGYLNTCVLEDMIFASVCVSLFLRRRDLSLLKDKSFLT